MAITVTYGKIGENYGTKKRFHDGKTMGFEWNFPWFSLGFNGNHRNWRNLLEFIGISWCPMAKLFENSEGFPWQNCLETPITGGAPAFQISTILLATMNHVCHGQKLDLIPILEEGHHHLKGLTYPF
jgi:hypothetical protein